MNAKDKSLKALKVDNRFVFLSLSILFTILILLMTYKSTVIPVSREKEEVVINRLSEVPVGEIISGISIEQSFICNNDNLIGISLNLATYARVNTGNLYIDLIEMDSLKIINTWEIDISTVTDNEFRQFELSDPIAESNGKMYKLKVYSNTLDSGNAVTIWSSINDSYDSGQLYINGVLQEGDLAFGINVLTNKYNFISYIYIIFTIASMLFLLVLGWLLFYKKNLSLEKCFLIMMLFLGILYMFVFPPYSAPDETAHYATAYKNSNILLLKQSVDGNGFPLVREEDTRYYGISTGKAYPNKETYLAVKENLLKLNQSKSIVPYPSSAAIEVSFLGHLPQSIGISIARILNLGNAPLFFMGKLINLLFYISLVYYAIKKMPFGKMIICAVSMLPMMLELASSVSYDSVIAALSFLFIAYCLNLIYEKDKIYKKDVIILAIIIACLSPLKVVYFMLVFLCILFPRNKFSQRRDYYLTIFTLISIAFLSMLLANINSLNRRAQSTNLPWIDLPSYSLSSLLQNPLHTIKIFINTVYVQLEVYLKTMIGSQLGWLNITISYWVIIGFIIILILSALKTKDEKIDIQCKEKIFYGFIALAVSGLILLSMLVSWTPITYNVIEGVQGRYFLPILPLALILLKTNQIRLENNIDRYLIFSLNILNILVISEVFIKISLR